MAATTTPMASSTMSLGSDLPMSGPEHWESGASGPGPRSARPASLESSRRKFPGRGFELTRPHLISRIVTLSMSSPQETGMEGFLLMRAHPLFLLQKPRFPDARGPEPARPAHRL